MFFNQVSKARKYHLNFQRKLIKYRIIIIIIIIDYKSFNFDFEFSGGAENKTNEVKFLSATEFNASAPVCISNTLSGKLRGADDLLQSSNSFKSFTTD